MPLRNEIREWHIYKLVNPKNRVYIGITTNLPKRIRNYQTINCLHQTALRYSLLKYGFEAHSFEVIESFSATVSQAYGKEIFWIRTYMSNYSKWPERNGLNLTEGGRGSHGRVMTDETKEKLRQANLGKKYSHETKAKLSAMKKGKKINRVFTEEEKQIARERNSKYRHTEEMKKFIGKCSKGNKNMLGKKQSESQKKKISELHKGNKYNLGRATSDKQKKKASEIFSKPIVQYDLYENFISSYPSIKEAIKGTGVSVWSIRQSAKGRVKNPRQFIFKYKEDVGFRPVSMKRRVFEQKSIII